MRYIPTLYMDKLVDDKLVDDGVIVHRAGNNWGYISLLVRRQSVVMVGVGVKFLSSESTLAHRIWSHVFPLDEYFAHDGLCLAEAFVLVEAYRALVACGHIKLYDGLADALCPITGVGE
jgi:hypothetical protein